MFDMGDATSTFQSLRRLSDVWHIDSSSMDAILGLSNGTFESLSSSSQAALPPEALEAAEALLHIRTVLHMLHAAPLAAEWMNYPNSNRIFGGKSPIDTLRQGGPPAVSEVLSLLEGRLQGY